MKTENAWYCLYTEAQAARIIPSFPIDLTFFFDNNNKKLVWKVLRNIRKDFRENDALRYLRKNTNSLKNSCVGVLGFLLSFPISVIKYPGRNKLRENGLILTHGCKLQPTIVGKWQQREEARNIGSHLCAKMYKDLWNK